METSLETKSRKGGRRKKKQVRSHKRKKKGGKRKVVDVIAYQRRARGRVSEHATVRGHYRSLPKAEKKEDTQDASS